ncbi:MAG: hypothetical protein ACRD0N_13380 [Acidimicrobiales bacterium]
MSLVDLILEVRDELDQAELVDAYVVLPLEEAPAVLGVLARLDLRPELAPEEWMRDRRHPAAADARPIPRRPLPILGRGTVTWRGGGMCVKPPFECDDVVLRRSDVVAAPHHRHGRDLLSGRSSRAPAADFGVVAVQIVHQVDEIWILGIWHLHRRP